MKELSSFKWVVCNTEIDDIVEKHSRLRSIWSGVQAHYSVCPSLWLYLFWKTPLTATTIIISVCRELVVINIEILISFVFLYFLACGFTICSKFKRDLEFNYNQLESRSHLNPRQRSSKSLLSDNAPVTASADGTLSLVSFWFLILLLETAIS